MVGKIHNISLNLNNKYVLYRIIYRLLIFINIYKLNSLYTKQFNIFLKYIIIYLYILKYSNIFI